MSTKLILFGNATKGEEDADLPEKVAMQRDDGDGPEPVSCPSLSDLLGAFEFARKRFAGGKLDVLEIVAHGTPGSVHLGAERLDRDKLVRFRNKGFDDFMAGEGRVEILGCSCAKGPVGELFLAEFAPLLLGKKGGTLVGHTEDVKAVPVVQWTFDFGTNLNVVVGVGGGVTLRGAQCLVVNTLRFRLGEYAAKIRTQGDSLSPGMKAYLARKMAIAASALGPDNLIPSFQKLYEACAALDDVEPQLASSCEDQAAGF
jgi:hypothetical protein